MCTESRLQSRTYLKQPPKTDRKTYVDVEINTDPWLPECPRCLERQRNSSSELTTNSFNNDQYIKAINYINSIHTLINGSILKQYQENDDGNISSQCNISMPDLPNFLSLVSGINENLGKKVSEMMSKTTSTSNINSVKLVKQSKSRKLKKKTLTKKINSCSSQVDENSFLDCTHLDKRNISQLNLKESYGTQGQFIRKTPTNLTTSDTESSGSGHKDISEYYIKQNPTVLAEPIEINNFKLIKKKDVYDTKSYKVINLANSRHKLIYPNEKVTCDKKVEHKHEKFGQKVSSSGDRQKTPIKSPKRHIAKKKNDKNSKSKDKNKVNKSDNGTLSDAELERYASELLYDSINTQKTKNSVKLGDSCKNESGDQYQSPGNISPVTSNENMKNSVKQVASTCLEKQNQPSSFIGNKSTNRTLSAGNKVHNVKKRSPSTVSCTEAKMKDKKFDDTKIKPKEHSKTPVIDLRAPNNYLKNKTRSNSPNDKRNFHSPLTMAHDRLIVLPHLHKQKPRQNVTLKKSPTWVLQQKDYDDFVCQVKPTPASCKSSNSAIQTDNEEVVVGTDSDINEDAVAEAQIKPNIQNSSRKAVAPNFLHNQDLMSTERTHPHTAKEIRNQPFRQVRKICSDPDEIMNVNKCFIKQRKTVDSDSLSSGSSDIKSDKESPYVKIERKSNPVHGFEQQQTKNNFINYVVGKTNR